jgi:dolichyl-phosphate beta-glucosyltransferase
VLNAPLLSVVIPAFNEEERLPPSLRRVLAFLEACGRPFEVIIVDDGSRDRTVERVRALGHAAVQLLTNERNYGKGYSVRRGMLAARGTRRLMTDADLSTPIEEVTRLLEQVDGGADIAIGSRAASGAQVLVHQAWHRENMGRLFNGLVRLLAVGGLRDTQCGFKLFTGTAADEVFRRARLDGFSFDVEALFLARRLGYRIVELPVTWRNDSASRVTLLKGAAAFVDLVRIRINAALGRYGRGASAVSST